MSFFSIPGDSVCNVEKHYHCVNTVGSYRCECRDGYKKDPFNFDDEPPCLNVDECKSNNGRGPCDHHCVDIDGSYECSCDEGFTLDDDRQSCVDIKECAANNGGCEQECHEEEGSYYCSCQSGYELAGNSENCVDINECLNGSSGCSHKCVNTKGGYKCSCSSRYTELSKDNRTCVDIDECAAGTHQCPPTQSCVNTDPSYDCVCPPGQAMRMSVCYEIDDCLGNPCGPEQDCIDKAGGYDCKCIDEGYLPSLINPTTCEDINECQNDPCQPNERCINKPGSFKCRRTTTTTTTTTTSTTSTTTTTTTTSTTTTTTEEIIMTTAPVTEKILGLPKLVFWLVVFAVIVICIGILVCVICLCKREQADDATGYRPGNGVKIYKSESDSKNSDSNDLNHELLRNTQPIFTGGNNNALDASHHSYNQAVNYEDKYHEPYDYGKQRNDYGQQQNDFNQSRTYHSSSTIPTQETNDAVNRPRPPPPQPPSHLTSYQYNNYHSNLNNQMSYPVAPKPVPLPRNPVN